MLHVYTYFIKYFCLASLINTWWDHLNSLISLAKRTEHFCYFELIQTAPFHRQKLDVEHNDCIFQLIKIETFNLKQCF